MPANAELIINLKTATALEPLHSCREFVEAGRCLASYGGSVVDLCRQVRISPAGCSRVKGRPT
jgi:hypothetical protein